MSALSLGSGIGMLYRNRPAAHNGVSYGGVAFLWKEDLGSFRRVRIDGDDRFELTACAGSLRGHRRKLVCVTCYLPPNTGKKEAEDCLGYIAGAVVDLKKKYSSPFIIIAGDFNQWDIGDHLAEFSDFREVDVGPTRADRQINRIFSNFGHSVTESRTWEPLETEADHQDEVRRSDHRVAYCRVELERVETFTWKEYTYRQYTQAAVEKFKDWIVMHQWHEVFSANGSNNKALAYQHTIQAAIDNFFPLRTTRKKSTDLPWRARQGYP